MIGVTLSSPRFRKLAVEAQARFEEATGLPSHLVSVPTERNYLAKLELHRSFKGQTVVYFDADLWFIQKCDLSSFDNQEEILGVKDPGIYDKTHFPYHDCKTLGLDVERYFNTGLIIWNDRHKHVFEKAREIYAATKGRLKDFGEQSVVNAAAQRTSKVRLISNSFNYMPFAEINKLAGMQTIRKPLTVHGAGYGPEIKLEAMHFLSKQYQIRS